MLKEQILKLREDGISYRQIAKKLNCALSTISYHCKRWSLNDIGLRKNNNISDIKNDIKNYCKEHTIEEAANFFDISKTSVKKYKDKKYKLTDIEKKKRQKIYLKSYREKLKDRCVEYKGGKCIICGYNKCNRSLDFHHRNPEEKDFGIGSSKVINWEQIKIELNKCDLVCKNCHGEIHDKLNKN